MLVQKPTVSHDFHQRDAMPWRVLAVGLCLNAFVCHMPVFIETAARIELFSGTQISTYPTMCFK